MPRRTKGRQKLEMVKISNESNLLVTFSKRRAGLFKKASELSTLCGAEITIIVFSPGKKVFSYGHPCVEDVIERYLTGKPRQTSGALQLVEAHRNARVRDLNLQLTQVLSQLEMEKKRGEQLNQMRKASLPQNWSEAPIEELDMSQLELLKLSLQELKQNVAKQAEQLLIQNSNQTQFYTPNTAAVGGEILPFDDGNDGGLSDYMFPYGYDLGTGHGFF